MKKTIKTLLKKVIYFNRKKNNNAKVARFTPIEREFLGRKLYIHDIASFNMCKGELFDSEAYNFKAKTKTPNIVDCGANMGMSIIYFKELYPKASITAFEADAHIFTFLEKNIESFKYENVELINKAVWDSEEELSFMAEGGAGGRIESASENGNKYKKVQATRLKNYLGKNKVDFLKIDIEGAEYRVLKDCKEEIKDIDFVFIEYHSMYGKRKNLHEILQIIDNAGFDYHIKEAHTTKYPFIKRELNYGMDLQLNLFCYKR